MVIKCRHSCKDILNVFIHIKIICPGCFYQAVSNGICSGSSLGVGKQLCTAVCRKWTDMGFCPVIRDWDLFVSHKGFQVLPLVDAVDQGFFQFFICSIITCKCFRFFRHSFFFGIITMQDRLLIESDSMVAYQYIDRFQHKVHHQGITEDICQYLLCVSIQYR